MEEDRSSRFSPSKLDVYKNCPKRYQFRYVDRIARERKTPETALGVAVHAAFEELYELVRGGRVPALGETQAFFDAEFARQWTDSIQLKDARFGREDWRKVGLDCVKLYYEAHAPFEEDRTIAVEKKVGFPIEVEGREYRVEGFVDRLSLAKDGVFEIHDYKTAKSLPSQEHADQDWQLALYELAVRREWPDAPGVRLKWHYVRHGKTLVSTRDEKARAGLREELGALISRIKHDHEFKHLVGPLCDWCEYRDLCPAFAHPEKVAALPPAERPKDDGVKLVDQLAEVDDRRRRLRDEMKTLDRQKGEIEERLADWAEAAGVSVAAGQDASAAVAIKEEIQLPSKTGAPEAWAELEKEARALPFWEQVARLDAHALIEGVKARRWAGELLTRAEALLERFGVRVRVRVVRLRRRRADED